jgi:hypothetical protein
VIYTIDSRGLYTSGFYDASNAGNSPFKMPAIQGIMEDQARDAGNRLAEPAAGFPPAGQEVVVDDADDVKAIGHDAGIGEMLPHQRAVDAGQIHAHHAHPFFAAQSLQIAFQRSLTAVEHDVEDGVLLQIAESGGVTVPADEVLKSALYRGAADVVVGWDKKG